MSGKNKQLRVPNYCLPTISSAQKDAFKSEERRVKTQKKKEIRQHVVLPTEKSKQNRTLNNRRNDSQTKESKANGCQLHSPNQTFVYKPRKHEMKDTLSKGDKNDPKKSSRSEGIPSLKLSNRNDVSQSTVVEQTSKLRDTTKHTLFQAKYEPDNHGAVSMQGNKNAFLVESIVVHDSISAESLHIGTPVIVQRNATDMSSIPLSYCKDKTVTLSNPNRKLLKDKSAITLPSCVCDDKQILTLHEDLFLDPSKRKKVRPERPGLVFTNQRRCLKSQGGKEYDDDDAPYSKNNQIKFDELGENGRDNTLDTPNLSFYRNEVTAKPSGLKIEELLQWHGQYIKLDKNHSFIQWLFPTEEQSNVNHHAYPLQLEEAEEIRDDPEIQSRYLRAYKMMLDFYGLKLKSSETGAIEKSENWRERLEHLNRSRHNHFRVTRIIRSLAIFGFGHFQKPLLTFLLKEKSESGILDKINDGTFSHWIDAIDNGDDLFRDTNIDGSNLNFVDENTKMQNKSDHTSNAFEMNEFPKLADDPVKRVTDINKTGHATESDGNDASVKQIYENKAESNIIMDKKREKGKDTDYDDDVEDDDDDDNDERRSDSKENSDDCDVRT